LSSTQELEKFGRSWELGQELRAATSLMGAGLPAGKILQLPRELEKFYNYRRSWHLTFLKNYFIIKGEF